MAKLKQIRPALPNLKPNVRIAAPASTGGPWRQDALSGGSFYKTARWQKLRMQILLRDAFTCQWPGCGRIEQDTSLLVADHIVPARIDPARIWDETNLQCLCKACHDGPKQAAETRTYGAAPPRWGGVGKT